MYAHISRFANLYLRQCSMLPHRLLLRFLLVFGVLYALVAAVSIALIMRWERDRLATDFRQSLREIAAAAVPADWPPRDETAAADLQARVTRLAAPLRARLTILDQSGAVIADSDGDPSHVPNQSRQPELLAAARQGEGIATRDGQPGDEMVWFAMKFNTPVRPGYVRASRTWAPLRQSLGSLRNRLLALAAAGALVLIAATCVLVVPLTRAAGALAASARAMTRGDFSRSAPSESVGEVADLARSFEQARLELAAQVERLRANSDRLTSVLGAMSEGVVAIDPRRRILFANGAARALLEFATSEVIGRPLLEAVRHREIHETVEQAFAAEEPCFREIEGQGTTRRVIAMHARRLPGAPSPGVLLVAHDVTELRRLEKLRQEFVANVSHELKTPLTVIKAFAETLLDGAIDDREHNRAFVLQISEQAERLHQLILDLLSVARMESGNERFDLQSLPLEPIVRSCLQRYAPAAEAKRVALTAGASLAGLLIYADEEGVREILDNLVDNAIKYTPAGGQVEIRCQAEAALVRIEVADTGIGIHSDHQGRIFERFYRVDKARSRELGGTGLGLSIVKHLVSALGGTVAVVSQPGGGSTFVVRLPRV